MQKNVYSWVFFLKTPVPDNLQIFFSNGLFLPLDADSAFLNRKYKTEVFEISTALASPMDQ